MTVEIILATYLPKFTYLQKQLNSLKNQTISNWICHIVDDASGEKIKQDILELVQGDDRFIPHFHSQNLGSYHNFERGLGYVSEQATVIGFCDQDDIWKPQKLEILLHALQQQDTILAHCDLELIDSQDRILQTSCWDYEGRTPESLTPELLLLKNVVTGCTLLFRAQLLSRILPFPLDPGWGWHHDWWITLIASYHGSIVHVRQPLVYYRQHETNVVGAVKNVGNFRSEFKTWIHNNPLRITGKGYQAYRDLQKAVDQRLAQQLTEPNSFQLRKTSYDLGLKFLYLLYKSWRVGYGAEGIALRLWGLKLLYDLKKINCILKYNLFR